MTGSEIRAVSVRIVPFLTLPRETEEEVVGELNRVLEELRRKTPRWRALGPAAPRALAAAAVLVLAVVFLGLPPEAVRTVRTVLFWLTLVSAALLMGHVILDRLLWGEPEQQQTRRLTTPLSRAAFDVLRACGFADLPLSLGPETLEYVRAAVRRERIPAAVTENGVLTVDTDRLRAEVEEFLAYTEYTRGRTSLDTGREIFARKVLADLGGENPEAAGEAAVAGIALLRRDCAYDIDFMAVLLAPREAVDRDLALVRETATGLERHLATLLRVLPLYRLGRLAFFTAAAARLISRYVESEVSGNAGPTP